jgi:hypothetical protein
LLIKINSKISCKLTLEKNPLAVPSVRKYFPRHLIYEDNRWF